MGKNKDNIWDNINSLWKAMESLEQRLPTTVELTQTVPIKTSPLAAEIDSMFPKTQPSSPSAPVDTGSGPAEPVLESVALKINGVWRLYDKTHVPDVDTTLSTLVKQPLKESVVSSVEESVKSLSKCKHPREYQTVAPDGHHFCGVCSETIPKE